MKTSRTFFAGLTTKPFPLVVGASRVLVLVVSSAVAQTWTQTSAPSTNWIAVASSADGRKLVAAESSFPDYVGLIYTSTNSGTDWQPTGEPGPYLQSLAT